MFNTPYIYKDQDPRTLAKLWDGFNNTTDDAHMWLTPLTLRSGGKIAKTNSSTKSSSSSSSSSASSFYKLSAVDEMVEALPSEEEFIGPNRIFVYFDEPVAISMVKLWNYSKVYIRHICRFLSLSHINPLYIVMNIYDFFFFFFK
jgi:hypothetical protein